MRPPSDGGGSGRPDLRRRFDRDVRRYERREPGNAAFWRSLGVLGSIGWPIVLGGVGGALLGRWLDARWQTGIRLTLLLLVGGIVAGGWIAWRAVQQGRPR